MMPALRRLPKCIPIAPQSQISIPSFRVDRRLPSQQPHPTFTYPPQPSRRQFSSSKDLRAKNNHEETAKELSRKGLEDQQDKEHGRDGFNSQIDNATEEQKELQARTPWHREGADKPPVRRNRSAGAMTKGKLLTTPSRLLKLTLPLTTLDKNSDRKTIEPLALLVHPTQPLSYLERLIQSELPMITAKDGKEKLPEVHFRAEDSAQDESTPAKPGKGEGEESAKEEEGSDEQMVDGKVLRLGKIEKDDSKKLAEKQDELKSGLRGGPGEGGVETYSGQGREGTSTQKAGEQKFVRWSSSTEIGDFIRDAARGKEFAVEIEGASEEIRVGVPSFNDRTHYLRVRLRKTSRKLSDYAGIKKECDALAHKSAQRLAMGGFGILMAWWGGCYYFTFRTSYGWDTMEPITYLAGLSTIMIGYLWFLYHNREVSYRSALNLTVSRRQNTLYQAKGFNLQKWESLIEEANALRREIKNVADEYDVEWDEREDEGSEVVHDALKEERRKGKKEREEDEEEEDDRKSKDDTKGKEKKVDKEK